MTNDEAVQWCGGKDLRVSWTSQGLVQFQMNIPVSDTVPRGSRILLVRQDFATAVTDAKALYDGVVAQSIPPGDPSLVSTRIPQ